MFKGIGVKISDWIDGNDTTTVFVCTVISSIAAGFMTGTYNVAVSITMFFGLAAIVRSL